jgi:SAM-dependent methyltransferase
MDAARPTRDLPERQTILRAGAGPAQSGRRHHHHAQREVGGMAHEHGHGEHGHGAGGHGAGEYTEEYWDERYRSAGRLWSGQPNAQLVAQASGLAPGDALDAGCGEGADAIWLAGRGWRVTGVDVSGVALERAARHAADQNTDQNTDQGDLAGRITWQRRDLLEWAPPADSFDLVTASFMHPAGDALPVFQRRLAGAVRPGGTLLILTHHADDVHANVGRPDDLRLFPSAEEMAATFDAGRWEVQVASAFARPALDMDGQPTTVKDTVLRVARRG